MTEKWQDGLFWKYQPETPKHKKVLPKKTWLAPDYLPNLEKAKALSFDTFKDDELWKSTDETLVFDLELYPNYFLLAFKSNETGKVIYFEKAKGKEPCLKTIAWIFENYKVVSFNGIKYDMPIVALLLGGKSIKDMHKASNELIQEGERPFVILRKHKVKKVKANHIDLIELCPLTGSLKIYGARLNTKQIQDLPFPPQDKLSEDQMAILRWYCINDLDNTLDVFRYLKKNIALRERLSAQYDIDLLSKSDAQIAEAVISTELWRQTGMRAQRVTYPDSRHKYDCPAYLNFKTEQLQKAKDIVSAETFYANPTGSIELPESIKELKLVIGETTYQMGIGGLHSTESNQSWISDESHVLIDRDVASYYPRIILNQELYPEHLGRAFLTVYQTIVERRLKAKKEGDKLTADSLKITINGGFGKFGNMYSVLYSPKLLIQVTLTGQLSLLYLIEKLELAGIRVVSGNTDGIVFKCPRDREDFVNSLIGEWENETGFDTEETRYVFLGSRSVNDYVALKEDMTCKGKGKLGRGITKLFKNPDNFICIQAIENFLSKGIPIEETIETCKDITEFLTVRTVTGGGVYQGQYLGKVVRWYYSKDNIEPIVYAKSGNKVPKSDGCKPYMTMQDGFPQDVDFDWYIVETQKMMREMGMRRIF